MLLFLENAAVKSLEPFQAVRQLLAALDIFDQQPDVVAIKVKEFLKALDLLLFLLILPSLASKLICESADCLFFLHNRIPQVSDFRLEPRSFPVKCQVFCGFLVSHLVFLPQK